MNKYQVILCVLILFFPVSCKIYHYTPDVTEPDLERHIQTLASDAFQGRMPGTTGDAKAGAYIEKRLEDLKLNTHRQEFSFLKAVIRGPGNSLEIAGKHSASAAFTPFSFTKDTMVDAQVAFAGYGISFKTDSIEWNDYAGLDVKGKWVLVLRGSPDIPEISGYLSMGSDDRDKAMLANDNGAAGILFVSGVNFDKDDHLVPVSLRQAPVGIPAMHISRALADTILREAKTTISDIESAINSKKESIAFNTVEMVKARSDVENVMGQTNNWYAIIEGADPVLKEEYLVIGAHYDHLGMGGPGSSSRRPDTVAVHNGADDNASGVSSMLELAGKLKANQGGLKRSVILVAFGAEEMGLLGSKTFISHPPVDLSRIAAMVNLDMLGRLDTMKGIQIGGTGTSLEADSLIQMANKQTCLKLILNREGSGPSDHSSFYGKNIPVFFITTGAHPDYHMPEDDADRINFRGLNLVTEFAYQLVLGIVNSSKKLSFREAGPKESTAPNYRFKVTLGFMPDFSASDLEGVRIDFVSKGKAAERAGLKNGDIIKAIDGLAVRNIYDYMYRLSKLTRNQIISVEVLRNGTKEIFIIQL